ncbi:MAG: hypothetical protein IJL73_04330 [Lachnospiraceae bacterium]|nr:hypothetical protein [Lachnospiraceae bacterium]
MKRIFILIVIVSLAAGLLSGCAGPKTPETEPLDQVTPVEDGQPSEKPADNETEETFEVATGYPYSGVVYEYCLYHINTLYTGKGILKKLPEGAVLIGKIRSTTAERLPDEELTAAQLYEGMKIYSMEGGKKLFAVYDETHVMQLEPYEGDREDLSIPPWMRRDPFPPKLSGDVDPSRRFCVSVFPNVDRDLVIEKIVKDLRAGLIYDLIGEKTFYVYAADAVEGKEDGMAWVRSLLAIEGVMAVERPQDLFPGEKESRLIHPPEMKDAVAKPGEGWREYPTLEEAETAFGSTFELPENDLEKIFRIGSGSSDTYVLEVLFLKDGNEIFRIRKATGYGDPSGDKEHKHLVCHIDGTQGDLETYYRNDEGNERFYTAYRAYTDYSYSVTAAEPMTEEELLKLFKDDKHKHPESRDYPNSRDISDYLPQNWENRAPIKPQEPVTKGEEDVPMPTDDTVREKFTFPRSGESGREYSPDTLIVTVDPAFDKEAVKATILKTFPVELKYDFRLAEYVIAVTAKEAPSEDALRDLAVKIWSTTGVSKVERDALNELNTVPVTTLSDI